MDIILSPEEVDLQECGILILGFFEDERPLRGSAGWIDWRLNGKLSHLLIEGRLTGEWEETTLLATQGRIVPPLLLLIGLGRVREYSYLRLRELSPHLFKTLRDLKPQEICFSLPHGETYNVDCGKLTAILLEGIVDCLDARTDDVEAWVRGLRVFFAEGEERFTETVLGVQTAKAILEGRVDMKILVPTEKPLRSPGAVHIVPD